MDCTQEQTMDWANRRFAAVIYMVVCIVYNAFASNSGIVSAAVSRVHSCSGLIMGFGSTPVLWGRLAKFVQQLLHLQKSVKVQVKSNCDML